eukprot:522060_1
MGPLKWMTPESITKKEYSKHSDVYMFGITMWGIFYGMEPYIDSTVFEAALSAVEDDKRPQIINDPQEYRHRKMPSGYRWLMQKCWDKDPNQRPTFAQIIISLEQQEALL